MPATVSHALSMTSPDDPAYENQPKHWNSAHNVTFNILATEISQLFSNKNGVSFGLDGTNITGSVSPGVPSPVNFSAGTTSSDLGSVVFANSNGISFGLNGATITGTVATNYLTTARASNDAIGLNTALTAGPVAVTANSSGLSLNFSSVAGTSTGFTGGASISGSMTHNTAGLAVSLSHPAWITTAMQSNAVTLSNIRVSAGTTSNLLSAFTLADSNGLAFGLNAGTITGSYSQSTHSHRTDFRAITLGGNTAGTTSFNASNNDTIFLNGGNNITLSGNGSTITISAAAQTNQSAIKAFGVSNTGQTAGNTGVSTGVDWVIAGSNSITLSQSTAAGGPNTVWIQHPAWITTTQTNQQMTMYATGNTTQSSTGTSNASSLIFRAEGGASVGITNGSVVISAPSGGGGAAISISGNSTSGGAGYSNISTGTAIFAGGPNITLSQDGSRISISANNPGAAAENNNINLLGANTAGNTTASGSTIGLSGLNLTLSGTNASQVVISAPATSSLSATGFLSISTNGSTISVGAGPLSFYATSNTTQSSSGTIDGRSISFNGAGNVSVGVSNGSIVISGSAGGGGGINAGVSNLGNTAGSTGTVSTGNVVFVGSRGVTLSQSTEAEGSQATITILGESENEIYRNFGQISAALTAQGNSLVSIQPFIVQHDLVFSNVMLPASFNVGSAANNSSAFMDLSVSGVLYSRNVSTLSYMTSFGANMTQTWSSNATGTVTGVIGITATLPAYTLSEGEYFWAFHVSTANTATGGAATTALGHTLSHILAYSIGSAANIVKRWGSQTNNSQGLYPGLGIISTGATRSSIAFTDYTMTGTRAFLAPIAFEMRNKTWQV